MVGGYQMNFNQDFTSLSVLSTTGFRLFSINGKDNIDEIFAKDTEHIRLVERLFNSSLVVLVTVQKPNCLKMLHFKKKQDICNCVYPSEILCVRMNRQRLIVCLAESIHIHDIRDMKILHSIENIATNELGLCTLSLSSHLAYPTSSTTGELRIFNASKLKAGITIKAHDSSLSAMCFSPSGTLLATASERGTVIRVFSVKTGERLQEFRRGVKRCVRICSLVFSSSGDFLCASSNTETVHIFKIDQKAVDEAEGGVASKKTGSLLTPSKEESASGSKAQKDQQQQQQNEPITTTSSPAALPSNSPSSSSAGWSGYLSKAVSSYLPSQVCEVLSQDRAFATAVLTQPGLKHVCGLTRLHKELKLLIACDDGFLYIYDLNVERGGTCKLLRVHDLRYALDGVIELNLTESVDKMTLTSVGKVGNTITQKAERPSTSIEAVPAAGAAAATAPKPAIPESKEETIKSTCGASVIIQNPDPAPDNSYAGILKGGSGVNLLTDSVKYRKLCDAIDTPPKLYDELQFPPVAIAAKD